ncbi:MAG: DNA-binding protein WhiA [Clostridia bacterium]|nr:DNA-binding protein WhiA [Clostridia bacterium]
MITVKIKEINMIPIQDQQIYFVIPNQIKEENLKAIIRGAFMGAGSVNNPEKEYHLEVDFGNEQNLQEMKKALQQLGICVKTLPLVIYIKEGEEISKFLALIGANKAVMQFEDIRIQKEMRGKVNRLVNCETANLNKTINASIEQIAAIKKLQENGKFKKLEDNLKEIAILRLENPNISLIELGKLLKEPVGKSGVNYRLKKIMEIAKGE